MNTLKIGDQLQDGSIIIRDEDRLCYQVLSSSRGATGIRTISKALLSEWVEAVKSDPHAQGGELREQLCGKTEIDKFEYGYFATLKKMADMVLGNVPVLHSTADFSDEFCKWFAENRGNGNDTTAKKYLAYFKTLTDAYQEPTHSYWHGLYKVMYGHDAEKEVAAIGELKEFEKIYGAILPALEQKVVSDDLDAVGSQKAIDWFWQPEVKPHTCVTSALNAFRDFLKWREVRGKELAVTDDALSIALQTFKVHRCDPEWAYPPDNPDWGYVSVNKGTREYYADLKKNIDNLDAQKVEEMFLGKKDAKGNVLFKPMWSGSNGTGWDSIKKGLEAEGSNTIEWIRKYAKSAADVVVFATKADDDNRPMGFGKSVESELLMKFHPDVAIKCGTKTMEVLEKLHLMTFKRKGTYDEWEYQQVLGIAADIKLRMDKLEITRTLEDNMKADYITVNEFIAWCAENENWNLIKEKVMRATTKKPEAACKEDGKMSVVEALKKDADSMMSRLTAALLTKPFAILAGASGTGKSRMVKKLAYMTCRADMLRSEKDETPGNYCMVAVKPNWHDSSELFGYRSAFGSRDYVTTDFIKFVLKAHAFPNTPFFVCLDEMNLAPVEQYFAEYLSAIESTGKNSQGEWTGDPLIQRGEFDANVANLFPEYQLPDGVIKAINEKGLFIPQNLFVVGTVNMDDTTNQFSRKVLDRAMTIMMNEVDFKTLKGESYEKLTNALRIKNEEIEKFIERTAFNGNLFADGDLETLLEDARKALLRSPFEVGYRYAIETAVYREALKFVTGKNGGDEAEQKDLTQTAIDHTVMMKILPRITGTLTERDEVLKKLEDFFAKLAPHKLSADMLKQMKETAGNNGNYISFWP